MTPEREDRAPETATTDARRVGLRLFEIETAFSSGLSSTSPGLRHFVKTRLMGQALRLAQLIRGMDVIENVDRLIAIASAQLHIDAMHFDSVVATLEEADLVLRRGSKIYEKVRLIDFGENYERVGDLWLQKSPDQREVMAVGVLNELVEAPRHSREIEALSSADQRERDLVLEVTKNAHLVEPIDVGTGDPVLFAPMMWDVEPSRLEQVLRQIKTANVAKVVRAVQQQPAGAELDRIAMTDVERSVANRAVTVGLLPTVPVSSAGGEKAFTFVPYTGALISDSTEREVLDRARAIVACVRYGERYALASKIRYPRSLLTALLDSSRDYALKWHTELKEQYAQLVKRGVGRIERNGSWYRFRLIPSEENLRAVRIAIELISQGEVLQERVPMDAEQHAALLAPGDIGTEFDGIRRAHAMKKATDDELEELVESARW